MGTNVYKKTDHDNLTLQELALYHDIMEYRVSLGLDEIKLSKGLTATAGRHAVDTRDNIWGEDINLPAGANLHSWSDRFYYSDHRAPEVMWEAPERLNTGYTGSGYEISAAGYSDIGAALEGWKDSPGHNAVIANLGGWAGSDFKAIGVGVETSSGPGAYGGKIYHVWFGTEKDPGGVPVVTGTSKSDKVTGTSFSDRIKGREGADTIKGGGGSDTLYGGAGRDGIKGNSGNDRLFGGEGADSVSGWKGADLLVGGKGTDRLKGGSGKDVFEFRKLSESKPGSGRDVITDFEAGRDMIKLTAIDARQGTPGNQAFSFIGESGFHGRAGELRSKGGRVAADTDGDGKADLQIKLEGASSLDASDFLL